MRNNEGSFMNVSRFYFCPLYLHTFAFLFLWIHTLHAKLKDQTQIMDSDSVVIDSDMDYPDAFVPKKCTILETNCESPDNVYMDVNITSTDTEGNGKSIYNSYCKVKIVESYDVNLNRNSSSSSGSIDIDKMPVIFSEVSQMYSPYSQSQVWIDPLRSPYVYNHYDPASQERFSIHEPGGLITVEQHNTDITQNVHCFKETNVCNYKEVQSPVKEVESWYRKVQESVTGQLDTNQIYYEVDEFDCEMFLSQQPKEIMIETQTTIRDEEKISSPQETNAIKQLMYSEVQTSSTAAIEVHNEAVIGEDEDGDRIRKANSVIATVMTKSIFLLSSDKAKKHIYRRICVVCQKSFDRIDGLKRHLIEHMIRSTLAKAPVTLTGSLNITCEVCQTEVFCKVVKYKEHLREHAKLTIFKCNFCDKSFSDSSNFSKHKKIHGNSSFQCDLCQRKFNSKKMIAQHMERHMKTKPVKCSFCNRSFHFDSMLNKHVRTTHRKKENLKYRCRFCDEVSRSVKEKLEHEWQAHNVRKIVRDCEVCGAQYRKYSDLKRHNVDVHGCMPTARKLFKRRNFHQSL